MEGLSAFFFSDCVYLTEHLSFAFFGWGLGFGYSNDSVPGHRWGLLASGMVSGIAWVEAYPGASIDIISLLMDVYIAEGLDRYIESQYKFLYAILTSY